MKKKTFITIMPSEPREKGMDFFMNIKNKISKKLITIFAIFAIAFLIFNIDYKIMAVSNDTTLKSIDITPKTEGLTQDQNNKNIYRAVVANDVTSVDVNVVPNDSNATVEVSGNRELEEGTNKVTVTVTTKERRKCRIYNLCKKIIKTYFRTKCCSKYSR